MRVLNFIALWFVMTTVVVTGGLTTATAQAAPVTIVAVGASNTNGKGVSRSAAWPAQLQAMLKAKGVDAHVSVNAVNGSTTSQMHARLKGVVAKKPQIVILSIPLTNDRRRKVDTYGNIASMRALLEKNGIKEIMIARPHVFGGHQMQRDRIHFNVAGHRTVAEKLVPMVLGALGKSN